MPKVSVIVPTYNRSKLAREAVESILRQTFADFQIIVVDDGSTDDTRSVIAGIDDNRLTYIYKPNGGQATAMNMGIASSSSEYVAVLESDDLWPPDFLAVMLQRLQDNPDYGLAYSPFLDCYGDGRTQVSFGPDRYLSGWVTKDFFKRPPFVIFSPTVFRRKTLDCFGWDEALRSCNDIDGFLRLSTRTQFLCVPDVCVTRRITSDSLTIRNGLDISPLAVLIYERFYFHLGGPEYVPDALAKRWFNRLYRGLAKAHYRAGNRVAAIRLFKKAVEYWPFDQHDYRWLLKTLLLDKKTDRLPHWRMPEPLPPHITAPQESGIR